MIAGDVDFERARRDIAYLERIRGFLTRGSVATGDVTIPVRDRRWRQARAALEAARAVAAETAISAGQDGDKPPVRRAVG